MSKLAKALTAAAGNAGGESLYVEDVFSTYLYTGNSANQNIVNGIDLAGEGGMVWTKRRDNSQLHGLFDTERGVLKYISSDRADAETTKSNTLKAFNSDGFQLGYESYPTSNSNAEKGVSWTFRKAEKFFDVVTWSGDNASSRAISHNLGCEVGAIFIKNLTTSENWVVYHKGAGLSGSIPKLLKLNLTDAVEADSGIVPSAPTTTEFYVSNAQQTNAGGKTYVAYLFASDAGGFGDDGSESIIKCGSYTGNGSAGLDIDLGFEPQWLLIKNASVSDNWLLFDVMRGIASPYPDPFLRPNLSNSEAVFATTNYVDVQATGFSVGSNPGVNGNGNTIIYIAIRRPMKTPESGTEVFNTVSLGTTTEPGFVSGFVTDFSIHRTVNETGSRQVSSRMTGNKYMFSDATNAEGSISAIQWDFMDGSRVGNGTANANEIQWMFKRATGFFDVVAFNLAGTEAHNLGVTPELLIVKSRSTTGNWFVQHKDVPLTTLFPLEENYAVDNPAYGTNQWNNTRATSTHFTTGSYSNYSTNIAYLFASVAGVSKVGSYTGTGSNVDVDCGFSAGARFILIKRTDSTGDWYVWDSERGIVAGNDPYLLLNSTAAEVTSTDYIDPLSSGFTVTSSAPAALNASGGTYIFLAIA